MKQKLLLAILLFVSLTPVKAITYYVDAARPDNSGAGTTWATAEKELQVAINEAVSGDQVWVKAGTYKPTTGADRTISFSMKNGVAIYGGFTGAETLLSQRNEIYNFSILSGDLLGNDIGVTNNGENSYHVFSNNGLNSTAVLDGFTVRGGNANLLTAPGCFGGGMYNENAAPTIRNSLFLYNVAQYSGGAIYSSTGTGTLTITNCVFNNNSLLSNGNGMAMFASNAIITNTVFTGNTNGFGVIYTQRFLSLYNCTIVSNDGLAQGFGGVYAENANVIVQNCVFNNNSFDATNTYSDIFSYNSSLAVSYSAIDFGGVNNVGYDFFVNLSNPIGADNIWRTADDGLRLACNSPSINAGTTNTTCINGIPGTDILGLARVGNPDKGAYEGNHTNLATNAIATVNTIVYVDQNATGTTNYSDCTKLVATINSTGVYTIAGSVTAKVWLETTQPAQYLKRHYEITPSTNAATATAKVTLYFTQQEFTDFNAVNTIKLPIDATDAANNKANLRIEKRSGTSSDGSGLPNTYPVGTPETITPSLVFWNSAASRWEVTFDVLTGFSGFFVKTISTVLPLRLLGFTGTNKNNTNKLEWSTAIETNTKQFNVEWMEATGQWAALGNVNAFGSGNHSYTINHNNPPAGTVFYRLKVVDTDGNFTYSHTVSLSRGGKNATSVYPNPASGFINITVANHLLNTKVQLYNAAGQLMQSRQIIAQVSQMVIKGYAKGVYQLRFVDGSVTTFIKD